METTTISALAGMLISLVFAYVPGASNWYAGLDGTYKRAVMLVALVTVVVIQYVLACAGWAVDFGLAVSCDRSGLVLLIQGFIAALVSNQATYLISPASK